MAAEGESGVMSTMPQEFMGVPTEGFGMDLILLFLRASLMVATLGVLRLCLWRYRLWNNYVTKSNAQPGDNLADHPHQWTADVGYIFALEKAPRRAVDDGVPDIPHSEKFISRVISKYSSEGHGLARCWAFNPYRLPMFARSFVLVWDPDCINDILVSKDAYGMFEKGHLYENLKPLVGNSLLSLPDNDEWKHQRKLAMAGFNHAVLQNATTAVVDVLHTIVFPVWDRSCDSEASVEVSRWAMHLILDVLGQAAFSYPLGGTEKYANQCSGIASSQSGMDVCSAFETITATLSRRSRVPFRKYFPTMENYRLHKATFMLESLIGKIIDERLQKNEGKTESVGSRRGSAYAGDLLSNLLQTDGKGSRLEKKYVVGNIKLFLFAGHDTTANVLSWALWHVALHQDIQRRLQEEVDTLFGEDDDKTVTMPTYSQLKQLRLLDSVIKETLRLNAPAGVARCPKRDVTIGKGERRYDIPAGQMIYFFPMYSHTNSDYWEQPTAFVPDRFLDEKLFSTSGCSEDGTKPRPFMPFSVGFRNCIGQQLAMTELRAALAHIVRRYEFTPCEDKPPPEPIMSLNVNPSPVWVKLKLRDL